MIDHGMKRQEQNDIMDDFIKTLMPKLAKAFPGYEAHVVTEKGYYPPPDKKVTEEDIMIVMKEVHKARIEYETLDAGTSTPEDKRADAYAKYMARADKLKALQDKYKKDRGND